MATYALSFSDIELPKKTLLSITRFTELTERMINDNGNITDNGMINIPSIRKPLFKSVIKGKRKSPRFAVENSDKYLLFSTETPATDELFSRYGINRIQLLLQASDDEIPLNKAAQLANISMYDADILIERARDVVVITTKRGQPRFVKTTDLETTPLSPLNIQYQSDLRLLSPLLSNAYRLRETLESDWAWFFEICSRKISNSRAYISFSKEEDKELQRFINIAKELLPLKHWLITSNKSILMKTMSSADFQNAKQQSNDTINTINIGIASRDNRSETRKWQYSPLLRFFVHMMLITDETLSIIDKES